MGTTANQKRLFFNLHRAKSKIAAVSEGDLHPAQVALIAQGLGVTEQDVIDMNRRLGGDVSLNFQASQDRPLLSFQDRLGDGTPPNGHNLDETPRRPQSR